MPFDPPVGMAQEGLTKLEDKVEVFPVTKHLVNKSPTGMDFLDGYKAAVGGNMSLLSKLNQIEEVYDSGIVPENLGHELMFVTKDGNHFNSFAETFDQAMHEGVTYHLSANH